MTRNKNILLVDCAGGRSMVPPMGIAVITALTPPDWNVDMWDEHVHGRITPETSFDRDYSIVGLSALCSAFLPRARALSTMLRARGYFVAMGGPGISARPEINDAFDAVFIGEAEKTWPRFLHDFENNRPERVYRQIDRIDMLSSPPPRWDPLGDDLQGKYLAGSIQTTRGCPFDCEFCDVIYLYGRRQRHKATRQVLQELETLHGLGFERVLFADDEFVGDKKYAKALMRQIESFQRSHGTNILFTTQTTLNIGKDPEVLELAADSGFEDLLIGIESPSTEALIAMNKRHNVRDDLVAVCHHMLSYGIGISGSFIIGSDADDTSCFEEHFDFYQKAFIPDVLVHPLVAYTGTKLWFRLRSEGRLLDFSKVMDKFGTVPWTNVIPARMTRVELLKGWEWIIDQLIPWRSVLERLAGWVSVLERVPSWADKSHPWGAELDDFVASLDASNEDKKLAHDLLVLARAQHPYMIPRLMFFIHKHEHRLEYFKFLRSYLAASIDVERKFRLDELKDTRPLRIPMAFTESITRVFQSVYERAFLRLRDREKVLDTLVEIFTDFLVRCGNTFTKFERKDVVFLEELTDRACDKRNGVLPQEGSPVAEISAPIPSWQQLRLHEAVLKGVGDELAHIASEQEEEWHGEHPRQPPLVPFP